MRFWSNLSIKVDKAKEPNVYSRWYLWGELCGMDNSAAPFQRFWSCVVFITFTRGKVLYYCLEHLSHNKKQIVVIYFTLDSLHM